MNARVAGAPRRGKLRTLPDRAPIFSIDEEILWLQTLGRTAPHERPTPVRTCIHPWIVSSCTYLVIGPFGCAARPVALTCDASPRGKRGDLPGPRSVLRTPDKTTPGVPMSIGNLLHPIAQVLHIASVIVWVGGMFFAHQCLRPVAAGVLEPPQRLTLWVGVFGRFFPWVWAVIITILATGLFMMFSYYGGMKAPTYVHIMFGLGLLMMLIFMHVFFAPYRRLKQAVAAQDWKAGARHLAMIRKLVGLNTSIGFVIVAVAAGGPWLGA